MRDIHHKIIKLQDRVKLCATDTGIVVCDLDGDSYSDEFPKSEWGYLGSGILIETEEAGLIHLTEEHVDFEKVEVVFVSE